MPLTKLHPKITRTKFLFLSLTLSSTTFFGQMLITELPDGEFKPDLEEIEDYEKGIELYDQYSLIVEVPKTRKDAGGLLVKGKVEDYYSNGFLLHKGTYADGVLKSFTNYYVNSSKERKFKGKKPGEGELQCYYINGDYRSVMNYYNYNVVGSEIYYNNGVLKRKEVLDKETLIPTLIVTKNNENTVMSKVALIQTDSLIYEKEVFMVSGHRTGYGRMVMDTITGDIVNEGPYYTFDKDGNFTSEVFYEGGNVSSIKFDERSEPEKKYFSYTPPAVSNNDTGESNTKSVELTSSVIPELYIRFDKNQDDFISNKEVDLAVSEFFEDDSITLDQINGLVNYFFEQD